MKASVLLGAALALTLNTASAQTTESGDAGNLPATAQVVGVSSTTISGALVGTGDVDMYRIVVTAGGTFSATTEGTVPATALGDTRLYLFNAAGAGVCYNDDTTGGTTLRSTLPNGGVCAVTTGSTYYIAVSNWPTMAIDATAGNIFCENNTTNPGPGTCSFSALLGPVDADPVSAWRCNSTGTCTAAGNYIITFGSAVIPVELTSFTGVASGTSADLRWTTASETNNAGFEVQVAALGSDDYRTLGYVAGHGTTAEAQSYSFRAENLTVGTHAFRLRQIDFDGNVAFHSGVEVAVETPGTHVLSAAYPNPFNPQTSFTLAVAQPQAVTAELFNGLGQRVAVLFQGQLEADASRTLTINGAGLSSGLYVVRVTGETFSDALRVSLVK